MGYLTWTYADCGANGDPVFNFTITTSDGLQSGQRRKNPARHQSVHRAVCHLDDPAQRAVCVGERHICLSPDIVRAAGTSSFEIAASDEMAMRVG